jgi:hypothetical protein
MKTKKLTSTSGFMGRPKIVYKAQDGTTQEINGHGCNTLKEAKDYIKTFPPASLARIVYDGLPDVEPKIEMPKEKTKRATEDINIELAKLEGWTSVGHWHYAGLAGDPPGYNPNSYNTLRKIPRYTQDLNAVHRLEKNLLNTQYLNDKYFGALVRIANDKFYKATALQRCEALLEALNK